jgi:hypothetical protein
VEEPVVEEPAAGLPLLLLDPAITLLYCLLLLGVIAALCCSHRRGSSAGDTCVRADRPPSYVKLFFAEPPPSYADATPPPPSYARAVRGWEGEDNESENDQLIPD